MKKFAKLLICFILCVFGVGLVACDDRTDKEKAFTYPKTEDEVSSNGGMAVQKGGYIYFVNGYQSAEDMTTQNDSYNLGSLLLMKLDSNGAVVTDEDGLLKDDYYITMSDKLCGFEATNLFIDGNFLYFTSPCQDNEGGENAANTNKEWARDRVDFFRIKLDKKGDVERLYTSQIEYENLEFKYYSVDEKVFILIHENGTNKDDDSKNNRLVRIDCSSKESDEIATNVSSVVMDNEFNKICYVKDVDGSYKLNSYNILSNESNEIESLSSSVTVELVGRDYVYVSYSNGSAKELKQYAILGFAGGVVCSDISKFDDLLISSDGDQVIVIRGNQIKFLTGNSVKPFDENKTIVDSDATSIKVIGLTDGSVVYYDNNGNIKIVSYTVSGEIKTVSTIESFKDSEEEIRVDIALDHEYIYFYKTVGSGSYLHRLKVVDNRGEVEEMIGVYLEADAPKIEKEETED